MDKTANIAIVILAAGGSSRMGTPKQLLKWKNTTLLGQAIETAEALKQSKTVVVLGANAELIKAKIDHFQVDILSNVNWDSGLGNTIAFGISHILESNLNIDGVLVMLADQPLIDSKYLSALIDKFESGKKQIIATSYNNGRHGVPVLFDATYFEELSQLNDDKGAKKLLQKYSDNVVVINTEHDVSDIDTLEDYQKLYKANH